MKKVIKSKVLSKFYDYQIEAFEKVQENDKGIVIMPTGTGKTYVQAGIIANDIIENPGFRMYVVNAPRIMLSYQLLEEVFKFNLENNIDAMYMAVHSGRVGEMDKLIKKQDELGFTHSPITNTTSPHGVSDMIERAKKANQPLIFLSTYNSAKRIEDGRGDATINIILNDEAHYLVQERFNTDFNDIECERKYFFTATTKETPSDEGLGMNNVDFYGERLFEMTPLDAINMGKMVRPRVHIVSSPNVIGQEDLDASLGKLVIKSFNEHRKLLKNKLSPKMLIAASGTEDMKNLIKSKEIKDFINGGGKFFAVASNNEVNNYINGERVNRREWLKQLQVDGSNPKQELIVIHFDILTEGIDVPGLTGVLFLRDLKKSKFIQTLGRVARLDINDRNLIDKKVITPNELDKMNKPYAWVIIPSVMVEDVDKLANLRSLISELRDFGFNPKEDIEPNDRGRGGEGEDDDPIVPDDKTRGIIGEIIEDYEHAIEEERVASLTWEEKIQEEKNQGKNSSTNFDF